MEIVLDIKELTWFCLNPLDFIFKLPFESKDRKNNGGGGRKCNSKSSIKYFIF